MKHDKKKIEEIRMKWYGKYSNKDYPKKFTDIVTKSSDYIAKEYGNDIRKQTIEEIIVLLKTSKDPFMFPITEERFIKALNELE